MIQIALSGCNGQMGQAMTRAARESDKARIVAGFDVNTASNGEYPVFSSPAEFDGRPDVVVDFSSPACFDGLMAFCTEKKVPLVLCTTGLSDEQLEAMKNASQIIPIFRSGNMSLGVNLVLDLIRRAAAVLGDKFDVEIVEKHHHRKVDAPSGTALMMAEAVGQALPYDPELVYERHSVRRKRRPEEIGIHSVRGGTIVGTHEVIFAGTDEVLEISHSAFSRDVFASGGMKAALFMAGISKPGLYSMTDLIAAEQE